MQVTPMVDELETRLEAARAREGDGLAALLYDQNPEVVASLLANPHLVPTEYSVQPMGDVIPLTRQAQAIRGPARVW
jgi:hypothetical protein